MSAVASIAVILSVVAGAALLAALVQMSNPTGHIEDPVGKWTTQRPVASAPATMPREFRSLLAAESKRWHDPGTWEHLVKRLDALEVELGGQPSLPPTPAYSRGWLESRIARIEALVGPAPTRTVLNPDTPQS